MTSRTIETDVRACDLMTWPVITIDADMTLKDAARFFMDHAFTGAPVLEDGKPVGVLTLKDLARYTEWHLAVEQVEEETARMGTRKMRRGYHYDRLRDTTVRQVMTPGIKTLPEDAPLRDVLRTILKGRFHRVFIKDKDGNIAGVISTLDVIRWLSDGR